MTPSDPIRPSHELSTPELRFRAGGARGAGTRVRHSLRALVALFLAGGLLSAQTPGTVSAQPQTPAQEEKQDLIGSLVAKAKSFLRVPYRRGGSSPSGFDCSGFVHHVFSNFGVLLSRASRTQATEGVPVDLDALRPGDLLFFTNPSSKRRIGHVGIYLGNGEFIHASSWGPKGQRGIRIAKLDEAYHSRHFATARRVLPEAEAQAMATQAQAQAKPTR